MIFWRLKRETNRIKTRDDLSTAIGKMNDCHVTGRGVIGCVKVSYMSRNWSAHYAGFILGIGSIRWLVAIVNTALILALTYPKAAVRTVSAMIFFHIFYYGNGHYLHENHIMHFSRTFLELSRTFGKIQGLSRPWKLIFKFKDFSRIPGPLRTLKKATFLSKRTY